jgi:hypothetical protein
MIVSLLTLWEAELTGSCGSGGKKVVEESGGRKWWNKVVEGECVIRIQNGEVDVRKSNRVLCEMRIAMSL